MITIIAGSRTFTNYLKFIKLMETIPWTITEVVSGGCRGADKMGEDWAKVKKIPIKQFPVDESEWALMGSAAGPIRNKRMADYAQACVVFWDGESPGTASMIEIAKSRDLQLKVIVY